MQKTTFTLILFVSLIQFAFAQKLLPVKQTENFYKEFEFRSSNTSTSNSLDFEFESTGLAIKISEGKSFSNTFIIANNDTFYISENHDIENIDGYKISNLVVFSIPIRKLTLYYPHSNDTIYFHLYNSGPGTASKTSYKSTSVPDCSMPLTVPQYEWRVGLPEPTGTVKPNKVSAIIIHHSAGSNTDSNYTQVIRNIYLYHTQSNHYDDIGYNFLIAQDGTIFNGRDGRGLIEVDNTLGAHFCSGNTGTMGICLLGTFTNVPPGAETINSLVKLITWKAAKEGLNPHSIIEHPKNDSLQVISGHRDGCNTECPGEMTYKMLPEIRDSVSSLLNNCPTASVLLIQNDNDFKIFPNPVISGKKLNIETFGNNSVKCITVFNALGKQINSTICFQEKNTELNTNTYPPGVYFIVLSNEKTVGIKKVIMLSDDN